MVHGALPLLPSLLRRTLMCVEVVEANVVSKYASDTVIGTVA